LALVRWQPRARKLRLEHAGSACPVLARGNQGRDTQADERDRKLWLETLGARPRGNWPPNAVPWPTSSRATRSSSATSMFSGLLRQACVTASRPTQALRVNYTALQHHLVATATRQSSRSGGQHPQPHRQFRPTLNLSQHHHPAQGLQRQPRIGQSHPSLGLCQIEIRRVLLRSPISLAKVVFPHGCGPRTAVTGFRFSEYSTCRRNSMR